MPSVCELKIELKKKGIKGISGLNKAGLEKLLATGVSAPAKPKSKPASKPAPKPAPKPSPKLSPKLLKMTEEPVKLLSSKMPALRKMESALESLLNNTTTLAGEKSNAIKKLKIVKDTISAKLKATKDKAMATKAKKKAAK